MEKGNKYNEILNGFCRGCLRTDRPLRLTSDDITSAYRIFVSQIDPENPPRFCTYCELQMIKTVAFLKQCCEAIKVLKSFHRFVQRDHLQVHCNLEVKRLEPTNIYPNSEYYVQKEEPDSENDSRSETSQAFSDSGDNLSITQVNETDSVTDKKGHKRMESSHAKDDADPNDKGSDEDSLYFELIQLHSHEPSPPLSPTQQTIGIDEPNQTVSHIPRRKILDSPLSDTRVSDSMSFNAGSPNEYENSNSSNINSALETGSNPDLEESKNRVPLTDSKSNTRRFRHERIALDKENEKSNNKYNKMSSKKLRSRDYCYYCGIMVLNFARHIYRHHRNEFEVQRIFSTPKKSTQRKLYLTDLRKKGNYILNSTNCVKPVKRLHGKYSPLDGEYLPCVYCYGFYSRKLLYRHKKTCRKKDDRAINMQAEGQNLLTRNLNIDKNLRKHVFPRMRSDKLSLVAKSDPLICAFGAHYMKIHKTKNSVNVTSRKMRELARLLVEIKKMKSDIVDLFQTLRPENYDVIVEAAKIVANYDKGIDDSCGAPAYAINIATSLKHCCDNAVMQILKEQRHYEQEDEAEIEANQKMLIALIDSNWRYDISHRPANNLKLNKCNKITIISLATDTKLFHDYLNNRAKSLTFKIGNGKDNIQNYTELLEIVLCKVLILNRRIPGQLQNIILCNYLNAIKENQQEYENYDKRSLSPVEGILINKLKRIFIKDKIGSIVSFFVNSQVQEDIILLLSIREKYISKTNLFLFGKPGHETSVFSLKTLSKHSRICGTKNSHALCSIRYCRYRSRLTQILSLDPKDIEQLHDSIGLKRNMQNPMLSDDVHHTAKLAKIVISMEDEKADDYKGKSLDDIELDLEEEIVGDDDIGQHDFIIDEIEPEVFPTGDYEQAKPYQDTSCEYGPKLDEIVSNLVHGNRKDRGKIRNLVPWTSEQKAAVIKFFKKHIKNNKAPKRNECEALKKQEPRLLENKDWLKIKVFVQNTYTKKTKY